MEKSLCSACKFFDTRGQGPDAKTWCFKNDIYVDKRYLKCEEFSLLEGPRIDSTDKYTGNPSYAGFKEREKDRKREHRINLLLSGAVGIIGIIIGVILGKFL